MLAFLSALPVIGQIVSALTTAFFNAKVQITQARVGGDRDVAVELVKTQAIVEHESTAKLSIISSNKVLLAIMVGMITPIILYEWQIIVYDIIWMRGMSSTDPIKGQVADWVTMIIGSVTGAGTTLGLGKMWFGNRSTG